MIQIRKSLLAEKDLVGTWLYTLENWGATQADRYLNELNNACKTIAQNPELGISCDEIREDHRKYHISKHVIFYKHTNNAVNVIRILSDKMDDAVHL
jgi:toxin ParE1/3/4